MLPSICTLRRSRSPSQMGGADLHGAVAEPRRATTDHGPAPLAIDLAQAGAAQSPPGRQKRDRFQQIGLAGAVRSGQHHRPRIGLEPQARIAAKIDQREPATATLAA